uniref:Uncharacterized protein n=1 Tax=Arion vulgaris TaxID=1028688 RepID=A0A0B6YUL5_9EUPU
MQKMNDLPPGICSSSSNSQVDDERNDEDDETHNDDEDQAFSSRFGLIVSGLAQLFGAFFNRHLGIVNVGFNAI